MEEKWRIDHRIPIALIFTIVMQSALAVWWAATAQRDITFNTELSRRNEIGVRENRDTLAEVVRSLRDNRDHVGAIEAMQSNFSETTKNIEILLGRIDERLTNIESQRF